MRHSNPGNSPCMFGLLWQGADRKERSCMCFGRWAQNIIWHVHSAGKAFTVWGLGKLKV